MTSVGRPRLAEKIKSMRGRKMVQKKSLISKGTTIKADATNSKPTPSVRPAVKPAIKNMVRGNITAAVKPLISARVSAALKTAVRG
jgi:hypothetical protein